MPLRSDRLDAIVSLSKRRGFVFPSSEIYGGLRAAWDYGPLGVELKENIKRQWWRAMVTEREDIVGLDSSVILAREVWEASRPRHRVRRPADRVHVAATSGTAPTTWGGLRGEARTPAGGRPGRDRVPELRHQRAVHRAEDVQRPAAAPPRRGRRRVRAGSTCGRRPRRASSSTTATCCRPRGARSRSASPRSASRSATRSPRATSSSAPRVRADGDGVLRPPGRGRGSGTSTGSTSAGTGTPAWASARRTCGCYEHPKEKLSHYSKRTVDIEYRFDFGGTECGELEGIANRTDFDLTTHSKASGAGPVLLRPGDGRAVHPVRHRAGGGR